jgi:hypothetical protein
VATLIPTAVFAAANLSPTVDADGDSVVAEEVGESGQVAAQTVSPDLLKLDSETLASLANGIDSETQELLFDPKTKQSLSEAMPGAWKVSVDALYYELARRTLADNKDKAARQSFALALFKDAERAKNAKDLAFEDHSADVVIAQLEGGRASARMDLQKLAEKGNRKARLYLGMDKPLPLESASSMSPTAHALSGTAMPGSASPTAAAISPTAAVGAPVAMSPVAAAGVPVAMTPAAAPVPLPAGQAVPGPATTPAPKGAAPIPEPVRPKK